MLCGVLADSARMGTRRVVPPHQPRLVVAATILLLVAITVARFAVANPIEAVGSLYVLPICLVAAELGWRAGVAAAFASIAGTVLWAVAQEVPLGVVGYGARAATFLAVGVIVGVLATQRLALQRQREELLDDLRRLAMTDDLTGLPNRRAWEERLSHELAVATRTASPLTVAAIDMDRLKIVNDTLGHDAGDAMLRAAARAWRELLDPADFLARLGGDEFFLLLPGCDAAASIALAKRLATGPGAAATCCVGVARWDGAAAPGVLMRLADDALYRAKGLGPGHVAVGAQAAGGAAAA